METGTAEAYCLHLNPEIYGIANCDDPGLLSRHTDVPTYVHLKLRGTIALLIIIFHQDIRRTTRYKTGLRGEVRFSRKCSSCQAMIVIVPAVSQKFGSDTSTLAAASSVPKEGLLFILLGVVLPVS